MQIVLARLDKDLAIAELGQVDLGRPHKFKEVNKPVALMWKTGATEGDVAKARAYAEKEGYSVFCYDKETDPLGKARAEVCK